MTASPAQLGWIVDHKKVDMVGPFTITYCRPGPEITGTEGAHLAGFPDGRGVLVLPDGSSTAQRRRSVVSGALRAICEQVGGEDHAIELARDRIRFIVDPIVYVVGTLAQADLSWSTVRLDGPRIESWLAEWLEAGGSASQLIDDLDADGWQIVRKAGA